MYNPSSGVESYMHALSPNSAESATPTRFEMRPITPKSRPNPKINYMKLLFMLAGAISFGLGYDAVLKMRHHNEVEYEWENDDNDNWDSMEEE